MYGIGSAGEVDSCRKSAKEHIASSAVAWGPLLSNILHPLTISFRLKIYLPKKLVEKSASTESETTAVFIEANA